MNAYQYIATTNPYAAKALCHSLGYKISNVKNEKDLGTCLEKIVHNEGEVALRKIMEQHPDKEVLLELFAKTDDEKNVAGMRYMNCNGGGCSGCPQQKESYHSFDGISEMKSSAFQANTFIIAASLILAVAIIAKSH